MGKGFKRTLKDARPDIAQEWDSELNGDVSPSDVALYSSKEYHWVCPKGHKYTLSVAKRTGRGYGCYYCSGSRPLPGVTDFKTIYPYIASEWDYELNKKKPDEYLPFSHYYANWICKKGHKFKCTIADRTAKGTICPYCSGRYPIQGETDLETVFPDLAAEWSNKNGKHKPREYSAHSNVPVWWKCRNCGHEWRAIINNRSKGKGCPICNK